MKYFYEIVAIFVAAVISSVVSHRLFDKETQFWQYELTFFGISGALYLTYVLLAKRRQKAA